MADDPDDLQRTELSEEVEYQEGGSGVTLAEERRGASMARGALYSILVAVVAGWIPVLGAVAAGSVGGWFSRSRMRGLYATQIAAIICITWLWLWTYLPEVPLFSQEARDRVVPTELFFGASGVAVAAVVISQYILCLLFGWLGGMAWEKRQGSQRDWPRPA